MFTKIAPPNLERISGGIISGPNGEGCTTPFPRPLSRPVLPVSPGPTSPQLPFPGGIQLPR